MYRDMLGLQLHGPSGSLMWMSLQSFVIHWAVPSPGMGNHEKCTVVHHFSCCACCSCVRVAHDSKLKTRLDVRPASRWSISCACN